MVSMFERLISGLATYGLQVVVAILTFVIGWPVAKFATRGLRRAF